MANSISLDISAKIRGYQDSLAKMKQAIDQLDPGAKISKSLQNAFQNAENYIKKLSRTPIVNVKSDQQLQNVARSLQQAGELINNINRQLQSAPTEAFRFEGIEESKKSIGELQTSLEQLQGISLSSILTGSEDLVKSLKSVGIEVDKVGAVQGLNKLDEQLQNTKTQAQAVKESIAKTKAEIASWKPNKDDGTLFSQKSGGKGTKLLNELQASVNPFKNMDFSKGGFSPEALSSMRERLMEQIKTQFGDKFQAPEVGEKIQAALTKVFDEGLTANNIRGRVEELMQEVKSTLELKGQNLTSVFSAVFGAGMGSGKASAGLTEDLKKMTLDADTGAQRLRQIIEDINRVRTISNKGDLIKLVDNGQLEEVRQKIIEILEAQKQLHLDNMKPPQEMQQALTQLQQKYETLIQQQEQLGNVRTNLQNNQNYAEQINAIDETISRLQTMREAFANAQKTAETGAKSGSAAISQQAAAWGLTNDEVQRYQQQLAQVQAREKFVGKLQGVVQRWFSVYAVIRMVSNAIKSMISTVQGLDKTITNIAIVTNMSQGDLWGQMPQYTQMARDYAASISGVYEVSQLYYQQGKLNI